MNDQKRSAGMEFAALILGIASIATACLVYPAFICGSLSIMFALLSRGGTRSFTPKAQIGLILGGIGLGVVIFLVAYTLTVAYVYFGGIEEMAEAMYGSMGIDYETLLRNMK